MRILSGVQPSGAGHIHLGNYLGAIAGLIEHQDLGDEVFVFVADWHALTTTPDPTQLKANIYSVTAAYLALGLDPARTSLYRQSDLPELPELAWVLSTLAPMGLLERAHSYKDKLAKGLPASVGLFTYPVLMAADILALQPDRVPVGRDQKQHLEIARDLALKCNDAYGTDWHLPEPEISESVAVVPGTDGEKMSKSYGNTIDIFAPEAVLKKQIMGIKTDSTPRGSPLAPDSCNVFRLFALLASAQDTAELKQKYLAGSVGYGDAKTLLFEQVLHRFAEARARYDQILADPAQLHKVWAGGAARARVLAVQTLSDLRQRIGLA